MLVGEPPNLSVLVDGVGVVWVRFDTGWRANWWRLCGDGLTVDDVNFDWVLLRGGGPFVKADAALAAAAVDKVRAYVTAVAR